ncbi:MAG: right-handed parallel beta-helix repeat-containing protein, partial [Acidobacteriota bacterium]
VFAQTNVSGNQSGTWTSNNSPYQVTGDVTVPTGQTLTIEPGVEVNFQGYFRFYVNGNLQAIGTEDSMILFTTDTPATGWGGLRVDTSDTIRLEYCRIEHGSALGSEYPDYHGGAMALLGSNATVRDCIFADNEAHDPDNELGMGGAVYSIGSTATVFSDCLFIRNHCYGEGGAIELSGDYDTVIENCEFIENTCNYGGGAVTGYMVDGTIIRGSTFIDNYTMYSNGGAIQIYGMGNLLYITNCTMTGNSAVTGDGGAVNLAYATAYLVNTIVYDNPGTYSDDVHVDWSATAEIYYSNLPMPDGATGDHNIDADPLFVDAANHDVNLQGTSPCIDAGVAYQESTGGAILVDLEPSQYQGSAPDIGAREYGLEGAEIFADGFESGGTSMWSVTSP